MTQAPSEHSSPPHPPVAPSYVSMPQSGYTPAPSLLELGGRVTRLMVARALWAADQGWRLVLPRLGWVLLTGLLCGVIGVLSLMLILPRMLAGMAAPADPRVAALAPAPAVEDFLRGQQTYDADLMWGSFSAELRQSLEGNAVTRDILAERIESERQAGRRYSGYKYIGGVQLPSSQAMYFYVVEVTSAQQRGTLSFVFTVGGDGKIVSVQ